MADLLVGQAGGGQQRDLAFLRRERVGCWLIGAGLGLPGCPELAGRPAGPWSGAEAFEDIEGSSQMRPRFLHGPGASQPFAVEELHPGQVERKVVNAGDRERFLEQPESAAVGRDDRLRPCGQQGQPGRDRGDVSAAHGGDMGGCLGAAAGADGGLDQVPGAPTGRAGRGRRSTRRANRRGVLVGILEITPP